MPSITKHLNALELMQSGTQSTSDNPAIQRLLDKWIACHQECMGYTEPDVLIEGSAFVWEADEIDEDGTVVIDEDGNFMTQSDLDIERDEIIRCTVHLMTRNFLEFLKREVPIRLAEQEFLEAQRNL